MKESPQRIPKKFRSFHKIFTFHLSPLFPYFFHIIPMMYVELSPYPLGSIPMVYVELSPYPLGSIPPFWQLLVEMNGEPNHGANGPFPQTAAVAHIIERYAYSCLLVRKIYIKIIKILSLLSFIIAILVWGIPHTMTSTVWSGWSRVGVFACSRGKIPTTVLTTMLARSPRISIFVGVYTGFFYLGTFNHHISSTLG